LIAPSFTQLAQDPSDAVKSCVAHVLAASLRHPSEETVAAFESLIVADDRLLATRQVVDLMIYIGMGQPHVIEPVIRRMLASQYTAVRESGGMLAAYAGLEFGSDNCLRPCKSLSLRTAQRGRGQQAYAPASCRGRQMQWLPLRHYCNSSTMMK
jgi:hypothetical protein